MSFYEKVKILFNKTFSYRVGVIAGILAVEFLTESILKDVIPSFITGSVSVLVLGMLIWYVSLINKKDTEVLMKAVETEKNRADELETKISTITADLNEALGQLDSISGKLNSVEKENSSIKKDVSKIEGSVKKREKELSRMIPKVNLKDVTVMVRGDEQLIRINENGKIYEFNARRGRITAVNGIKYGE